jgi:hypothetical protein
MTYKEVEAILGPASEEAASGGDGQFRTVLLTWKGTSSWLTGANCAITFQNGRVEAKAQFGLQSDPNAAEEEKAEAKRRDEEELAKARRRAEENAERARRDEARRRAIDDAKWRSWTAADGTHTVEAKFISANAAAVCMEKRDGTRIWVNKEKLSEKDLAWVKRQGWKKALPGD